MSRLETAARLGKAIDEIFIKYGIDPNLASLCALELAIVPPEKFVDQMIIRRGHQGLSRGMLANRLERDDGTLVRWEGNTSPRLLVAKQWAHGLGLELDLLLSPLHGNS